MTLLSKLDRNKVNPGKSACTIIKHDAEHKKYPQSMPDIAVTALEDKEYYDDRDPGQIHPKDINEGTRWTKIISVDLVA